VAKDPRARPDFESHFATLTHSLSRMRRPLRGESGAIAQQLTDDEENALQLGLALGSTGLLIGIVAFAFILRTLRPLQALRARARDVAGGDYARRTDVPSRDEIGELVREFDAMAAAIAEREQRLIRSERLATVGRMASQITHEVRNPLASIGLYAELLGDEIAEKGPEPRRLVTSIISEVDRLTEITETYLRFARLPQAKLEREDLGSVVRSVLEFSRAELAQAGIALELETAPDLPDIAADEAQLRQALLNLVRNAREAMQGGQGTLAVTVDVVPAAASAGGAAAGPVEVRLRLRDSGPGITDQDLSKIFDPFFSTKAKGTGLGLALVQQIVAEHGGRIDVRSPAGAGTTFTLTFPSLPSAQTLREPASREPAPGEPDEGGAASGAAAPAAARAQA
jgi:signal transduction histidine kinase